MITDNDYFFFFKALTNRLLKYSSLHRNNCKIITYYTNNIDKTCSVNQYYSFTPFFICYNADSPLSLLFVNNISKCHY